VFLLNKTFFTVGGMLLQPIFGWNSVVQLLLTYGPFYKNVTTCGPLPTKWCVKQQIRNIWN